MKIVKRILIVLVVLIALCAVIGLFLPADIHVERTMTMNAKPEKVYNYVNNMHLYNQWSPWFLKDTAAKYTFEGPESGVGAKVTWESEHSQVGSGYQVTTEVIPNQMIKRELHFMEGDRPAYATFKFDPDGDGTKVTWMMDANLGGNPFMHVMGAMMTGMAGKEFEKGLATLKIKTETLPDEPASNIEQTTVSHMNYLAVRDTASISTIGMKLGKMYDEIQAAMKKQNLNFAGPPITIYYTDSPTNWEFDAAIPVDKPGKAEGNVKPGEIMAGNAIVTHYKGAYEGLGGAWADAQQYIASNNKKITGAPWEVYITDPATEKDTTKWKTDIYYPVE